jgi:hypothetical protein
MLTVVATLGVLLVTVQGTLYYKAKGSARFLGMEKTKVVAQQLAEAGVEENIADIGRRTLRIHSGMSDTVTYAEKSFGGGSYTTRLTTVGLGVAADTIDILSTGKVGKGSQSVTTRMKLRKVMDTTRTPRVVVAPETSYTYLNHSVPDTARVTTVQDPMEMPDVDKTPAYTACMASSPKKCDVCHLPGSDVTKANVINISKSAIGTHITHHGDYVTTDGTCDIYKPKIKETISFRTVMDSTRTIVNKTTYDTTVVIDTMVKVQVLSWR